VQSGDQVTFGFLSHNAAQSINDDASYKPHGCELGQQRAASLQRESIPAGFPGPTRRKARADVARPDGVPDAMTNDITASDAEGRSLRLRASARRCAAGSCQC
jgi:hypothetical protein